MMLNMAYYWPDYTPLAPNQTEPARPLNWKPNITYRRQKSILTYERSHMTMRLSLVGADVHGWRNALNYFGWGDIKAGVYRDISYRSFDSAAQSTVTAIALYRKPVGILAWSGDHAQFVTGYKVEGEDPRTGSTNFKVIGVYLTDPLSKYGRRDYYVPIGTWKSGRDSIRFSPYQSIHWARIDPIDKKRGSDEWSGRWVVVAPVA
jgi:hypothetical protein